MARRHGMHSACARSARAGRLASCADSDCQWVAGSPVNSRWPITDSGRRGAAENILLTLLSCELFPDNAHQFP